MKPLHYKIILNVFLLAIATIAWGQSPFKKEYHEKFDASKVTKLMLESKFGNVTIMDNGSNTVTVDVVVEVHESREQTAAKIMDRININIDLEGGALMVETKIESSGMGKGSFTINYDINIPKNKDIIASSKYGNLFIEELTGNGMFEIAYGNLTAKKLNTKRKLMLELAYGNGKIEELNDALMEIKYSNLEINDKAGDLVLEGKYSQFKINSANKLIMDSKSDDIKINELQELIIEMGYSNITVQKLATTLVADTEYGNINVQYISPDFKQIAIETNYGDVKLGIDKSASYQVDMESSYGDINVPESPRINREKDKQNVHVYGIVGPKAPTAKIATESNYGSVRIISK